MAEHPFMPLWTDAYLADTHHLTTLEHGAYLLLLLTAWRTKEKCLLDDDKLLARYTGLTPSQWKRVAPTIRAFFDAKDGRLYQGRLTREAKAVKQKCERQSRNAMAKYQKSNKTDSAMGVPNASQTDAARAIAIAKTNESPKGGDSGAPLTPLVSQDLEEAVSIWNEMAGRCGLSIQSARCGEQDHQGRQCRAHARDVTPTTAEESHDQERPGEL